MNAAALKTEAVGQEEWNIRDFIWDPIRGVVIRHTGNAENVAVSAQIYSEEPDRSLLAGGGSNQEIGVAPAHWDAQGKASSKGPLLCQVAGCGKDLMEEKTYYRRHRVCSIHLKMLSLVVDGCPSRFCQQCGKFHDLREFDGDRRSCRARLVVHNARRRKRDPSDPQAVGEDVFSSLSSPFQRKGPLITVDLPGMEQVVNYPFGDQYHHSSTDSGTLSRSADATTGVSPWDASGRPLQQQQQSLSNWGRNENTGFDQHQSHAPISLSSAAFNPRQDAMQQQQHTNLLWPKQPPLPNMNGDAGRARMKAKAVARSPEISRGQDDVRNGSLNQQGSGLDNAFPAPIADSAVPRKNLSSLEVARALMEGGNAQPQPYVPDDAMQRISLKVANCTPDQLSADMFCRLRSLLLTADASVVQGFLRPGCTHLVLDVCLHGRGRPASDLRPDLLFRAVGPALTEDHDVSVQRDDGSLTIFRAADGEAANALLLPDISPGCPVLPRLVYATPVAVIGGQSSSNSIELCVAGQGLLLPGTKVMLRSQGGYLPVRWYPADAQVASAMRASFIPPSHGHLCPPEMMHPLDVIKVVVTNSAAAHVTPGLAMLEVQAPGLSHVLSNWLPVVLTDSEEEASDLNRTTQELRTDYGRVMDYIFTVRRYRHINLVHDDASAVRTQAELQRLLIKARALLSHCLGPAELSCLVARLNLASLQLVEDLRDLISGISADSVILDDSAFRMSSSNLAFLSAEHIDHNTAEPAETDENWLASMLMSNTKLCSVVDEEPPTLERACMLPKLSADAGQCEESDGFRISRPNTTGTSSLYSIGLLYSIHGGDGPIRAETVCQSADKSYDLKKIAYGFRTVSF